MEPPYRSRLAGSAGHYAGCGRLLLDDMERHRWFIVLESMGSAPRPVTDYISAMAISGLAVWAGSTPNGAGNDDQAAFDDFSVALP